MTATLAADRLVIDKPGIYEIDEATYHADPVAAGSLSSHGARDLLPPNCPAIFDWNRRYGEVHKAAYDLGHAVHAIVLGAGMKICHVDAEDYRTKDARAARDGAYARGEVPLLPHEFVLAEEMADALMAQRHVARMFDPDGLPEQSLFWMDEETGVWCRARPDWLLPYRVVDLKTTTSADVEHIAREVHRHGYYQQAPFYLDGAVELDLIPDDAPFLFVFVAKTPPYLATVAELDDEAMAAGRARNRVALEIFRDCRESGIWPGHSTEIETVSLPRWAVRRDLEGTFLP